MKSLIFVVIFLQATQCFAQFQQTETTKETPIGKAKAGGIKFSELSYFVSGEDTTYHYYYKDKKFSSLNVWESVYFKGGAAVLDALYTSLKSAIDADKGTESSFKIGETNVFVTSARMLGTKYINMGLTKKGGAVGITDLTGKQLDNLFNKEGE